MRMIAPRTGAPEVTVAEEQEEYLTLTAAYYEPGVLLTRWRLSDEEREQVAAGADLYIALQTGGGPMQPLSVQVGADGWWRGGLGE